MDSRVRSACYPRGSFYPLSPNLPKKSWGITKTCFRTCSTCRSHSQAGLCLCTSSPIAIRTKPTFVRSRYLLASDCPSQTTRLTLSPSSSSELSGKVCCSKREVLHWRPPNRRAPSYARQFQTTFQCQVVVKLHGVFLSKSM